MFNKDYLRKCYFGRYFTPIIQELKDLLTSYSK